MIKHFLLIVAILCLLIPSGGDARMGMWIAGGGIEAAEEPAGIEQVGSATTGKKDNGYGNIVTSERTLGTGSNRCLVACVASSDGGNAIASVTFDSGGANETALTHVNRTTYDYGAVEIWQKAAAPSGATGTFTAVLTGGGEWRGHLVVTEWTGVDQSTPLENYNGASGESTTPSVAVTSESGAVVIDVFVTGEASATCHESQTEIYNQDNDDGGRLCGVSKEAGAASVTMSWSMSSGYWAIAGASINAAE